MKINSNRLLSNLETLGRIGALPEGGVCRAALTVEDQKARDWLGKYIQDLGMKMEVDQLGNMFAVHRGSGFSNSIMTGSHLDTVYTGGLYDGSLGVLAGLEVIESVLEEGTELQRPIVLANFTNEEGVRFAPDMMGSLVFSGQVSAEEIWNIKANPEDVNIKQALESTGYLGDQPCGFFKPHAFIELHIEQGPVLENENLDVGVVEFLQGIFWSRYTIRGNSAHAGTTPMHMRKDSMLMAARIIEKVNEISLDLNGVGTVGSLQTFPDAINIVAEETTFTVDLRNPDGNRLVEMQNRLDKYLKEQVGFLINSEILVRLEPVCFDQKIVHLLESEASKLGLSQRRMISGAGHDAQMISSVCPTAMIFVPSVDGISHNVEEKTLEKDLINGTKLLKSAILKLANS